MSKDSSRSNQKCYLNLIYYSFNDRIITFWIANFQILDGLCKQTGSFRKECHALVDTYYLPLYEMLMSEVQPKEVCESVGLCGLSSIFLAQPVSSSIIFTEFYILSQVIE